jgi:hypothetical protein
VRLSRPTGSVGSRASEGSVEGSALPTDGILRLGVGIPPETRSAEPTAAPDVTPTTAVGTAAETPKVGPDHPDYSLGEPVNGQDLPVGHTPPLEDQTLLASPTADPTGTAGGGTSDNSGTVGGSTTTATVGDGASESGGPPGGGTARGGGGTPHTFSSLGYPLMTRSGSASVRLSRPTVSVGSRASEGPAEGPALPTDGTLRLGEEFLLETRSAEPTAAPGGTPATDARTAAETPRSTTNYPDSYARLVCNAEA